MPLILSQLEKIIPTSIFCVSFLLYGCGKSVGIDRVCEDQEQHTQNLQNIYKNLPQFLSKTGINKAELFEPEFKLWTDGADKERYIYLPEGMTINNSDMDSWVFPEGTKVWKTFLIKGKKIETRILYKNGPTRSDWLASSYIWNEDGSDAALSPAGEVDALNTEHNVPAARDCMACHGGRKSVVLGFSSIQLAHKKSNLTLQSVSDKGWLSTPVKSTPKVPGNELEKSALGYLHANCSHCHNPQKARLNIEKCFSPERNFNFNLSVNDQIIENTQTYRTAISKVIKPQQPDRSDIIRQMGNRRIDSRMPPIGTEKIDTQAIQSLTQWINSLEVQSGVGRGTERGK